MFTGMIIKIFEDTNVKSYTDHIDKCGYNYTVCSNKIVVGECKRNKYDTVEMGRQLKLARCRKKITRKDLSKRIWATSNTIGVWERGERMPSEDYLERFCNVVGLDMESLKAAVKLS